MKKILSAVFALFISASVFAVDIPFTWKFNPISDMITSYVIEYARPGTVNSNFVAVVTILGTTNSAVVKNLPLGTYKFRLIAKNGIGSSVPTQEIMVPTNAPSTPLEFRIVPTP